MPTDERREGTHDDPVSPPGREPSCVLSVPEGQARLAADRASFELSDVVLGAQDDRRRVDGSFCRLGAVRCEDGRWRPVPMGDRQSPSARKDRAVVLQKDGTGTLSLEGYWSMRSPAVPGVRLQLDLEALLQTSQLLVAAGAVVAGQFELEDLLVPLGGAEEPASVRPVFDAGEPGSLLFAAGAEEDETARDEEATGPRANNIGGLFAPLLEAGPPCRRPLLIGRLAGEELSYVEMCHPAGCRGLVVSRPAGGVRHAEDGMRDSESPTRRSARRVPDSAFQTAWLLFFRELEKGVILRGRVRGCFVPRDKDLQIAEQLYAAMLAEPPPLSA